MTVSFTCPSCNKGYKLRDEMAGKRVKCPCGNRFVVPNAAPVDDIDVDSSPGRLSDILDDSFPAQESAPSLQPINRASNKSGISPPIVAAIAGGGVVAVLLIAAVVLLWPGSDANDEPTSAPRQTSPNDSIAETKPKIGFATPEEAFQAANRATIEDDGAAFLGLFAPDSQDRIAAGIAYGAILLSKTGDSASEIIDVLEKYGIDETTRDVPLPTTISRDNVDQMRQEMERIQRELADTIKDKHAFCAEIMTLMSRVQRERMGDESANVRQAMAASELVDLQINGDHASGQRVSVVNGKTIKGPVHFRRIGGRWYLHQPAPNETRQGMDEDVAE